MRQGPIEVILSQLYTNKSYHNPGLGILTGITIFEEKTSTKSPGTCRDSIWGSSKQILSSISIVQFRPVCPKRTTFQCNFDAKRLRKTSSKMR